MQDGDLGEDIEREAEIVESFEHRSKFQNDDAHLDPSRWWFASSAFPMVAGTLGPVASAFSICALVRPWRQHLASGQTIDQATFIKDEPWLTIVNAIQLAVAIISNLYLLLNMAKRVRFTLAQPITIVGWYISSICLLSLNATAAGPLLETVKYPHEEIVWSQAFYYGMYAAILYFIDASLMVVTFWGASANHYGKDFELTASQRTLMLQTIMFLIYLLVGALVFSNIEGWDYLDAVYWADVTLFTVGFGDFACSTVLGRSLMMPYALVGVISLGLVIGSIRSLVLERGRRRMAARLEEKKRRRVVRSMTAKGNDEILEPIREDSILSRSQSDSLPSNEYERRKAEFGLMRKIQSQSSSRRRWMAMAISTGSWLILWLVGAVVFEQSEKPYQKWSYFDSFYFCFEALTTIGYGDTTPLSNAGKSFFVFWSLLALPTMTVLISNAGDTVVKVIRDNTIRLGNLTILPGEEDFVGSSKHILSKVTKGKMFPGHLDTAAPGVIVDLSKQTDERNGDVLTDSANESHESIQDVNRGRPTNTAIDQRVPVHRPQGNRTSSTFTSRVRRDLSRIRNPYDDLPTGTDFHFLLISEIQVISTHLKDSKPRRYTYEQWAWYLKLIGEDERSAETHRKAKPKEKLEDEEVTWSWVGNRSPLMGSQEESEWILERLVDRLRESLSVEGRRHRRGGERGANRSHRAASRDSHEGEKEGKRGHRENGNGDVKKKQG